MEIAGTDYYHYFLQEARTILEAAKENKTEFAEYFLSSGEGLDEIIVNRKFDNYVNEIQKDGFYAGNLEIAISSILFNLNITIYKLINESDSIYTHFTNI